MRFISVSDFRGKSAAVWKQLAQEKELVVTSSGKPIAILCVTSGQTLEESISAIRAARAVAATEALQKRSAETGKDRMSLEEIDAEIKAVRKARAK